MIQGKWYPTGSSKEFDAHLNVHEDAFSLLVDEKIQYTGSLDSLSISNRLANTRRKIILDDGSIFYTYDNDSIDVFTEDAFKISTILHSLESKLRFVVLFFVVILLGSVLFFTYGLPTVSKKLAYILPEATSKIISNNTMKLLDSYIFKKTKIPLDKQEQIRTHFSKKLLPFSPLEQTNFKIHFRLLKDGNTSIANAMALPSGDIILTDKFVQLCQTQDEMDSVLLHEMGHVIYKHTLQMLIKTTFISVLTVMVVGDTNALGDMSVGLGSLLINSSYSQNYEREADIYAFDTMLLMQIDPHAFASIMEKITSSSLIKENEGMTSYISSHPSTKERIIRAQRYSECYKKSLKECVEEEEEK